MCFILIEKDFCVFSLSSSFSCYSPVLIFSHRLFFLCFDNVQLDVQKSDIIG